MPNVWQRSGRRNPAVGEQCAVTRCGCTTAFRPSPEMAQLYSQHCALQTLKAHVVAFKDVLILFLAAPVAQHAPLACKFRVGRDPHPAFAIGAEVLSGIEAKAAEIAEAT